jgi:hypothetical protein
MRKRGRGRPKFPAGEAKRASVHVRLRPEELARMRAAARAAGLTLSIWIRTRLLEGLEKSE